MRSAPEVESSTDVTAAPPPGKIRCDACPVLCYIAEGRAGACDRYANEAGRLVRVDPLVILSAGARPVPFLAAEWDGSVLPTGSPDAAGPEGQDGGGAGPDAAPAPAPGAGRFVTAIGAGTTYPDYKPAPFIVASQIDGVDMVTVVTEGIYSYCGVKVKIDTDRHIGPETATVRHLGEAVGHVTTGEYGSQMLSLGGVNHLTGGSKKEGRATCAALLDLCNRKAVELTVDGGVALTVQAGAAPVVDGVPESRMRVGCGSAAIGMFAQQWFRHADEVVVVDDHITGVLSEHQAGKLLGVPPTGIRIRGHRSTPGRYFRVAAPGQGWGGTDITDPLAIIDRFDPRHARPGLRMLMVSTTGDHAAWFVLDEALRPVAAEMPAAIRASVARVQENCEPALCSVVFVAGAGGSLRSGVTENPVALTRSVRATLTQVTCGGAPVFLWPGGGITFMVDVLAVPDNAFGYVPTPALVAPIEFTLRLSDYAAMGGHLGAVVPLDEVVRGREVHPGPAGQWPLRRQNFPWG